MTNAPRLGWIRWRRQVSYSMSVDKANRRMHFFTCSGFRCLACHLEETFVAKDTFYLITGYNGALNYATLLPWTCIENPSARYRDIWRPSWRPLVPVCGTLFRLADGSILIYNVGWCDWHWVTWLKREMAPTSSALASFVPFKSSTNLDRNQMKRELNCVLNTPERKRPDWKFQSLFT